MTYPGHTWVDGAAGGTPIDAATLNELEAGVIAANDFAAGDTKTQWKVAGAWPARLTDRADVHILWKGAEPGPTIVTSGTAGARQDVDTFLATP